MKNGGKKGSVGEGGRKEEGGREGREGGRLEGKKGRKECHDVTQKKIQAPSGNQTLCLTVVILTVLPLMYPWPLD